MSRLFGTDGVRGVANQELTPDLAYKLGKAGAYVLGRQGERPLLAIGKDTRISGDMLEAALTAGILSVGGEELEATDDICYVYGRNITYFCHNIPKE
jgi:phosphoglucosamine mutase